MALAPQVSKTKSTFTQPEAAQITQLLPISPQKTPQAQPRAKGELKLCTKPASAGTVIDTLYQSGSAKCLFPRSRGAALEAVFLNTAGGVTGGDAFAYSAKARAGTTLTVTTQACERAYKAQPAEVGRIRNTLKIGAGARVNWLPQETILFNQSALDRRLSVEMEADGSLLMVEPLVFGRTAMGETLTQAFFHDRIEIRRASAPLYSDAITLQGDLNAHLSHRFIANGAMAMASLVYVADTASSQMTKIRSMLPETAGASLLHDDVLVMRLLAPDSFGLRQSLVPILEHLTDHTLPRCWMI